MTDFEGLDPSMILRHTAGKTLASREIALTMAEMLIKKDYGEEHFKTQLPLQIFDDGDRWRIEGSRKGEDFEVPEGQLHEDKAVIEIRKVNCEVLKIVRFVW
jgi:hypothetical protein